MKIRFHMTTGISHPSIRLNVGRPTKKPERSEKLNFDEFHHYPCLDKNAHLLTWSKKKFFHWDKKTRRLRINKQIIIKEMEFDGFALAMEPFCKHCIGDYGKIVSLRKGLLTATRYCPVCKRVTKE